ncbi:MAG: hypothetical protein MJ025_03605 [Victivallaceae bacterium]|nr:hypothetical protein [Victivallaceae bacterium]
MRRLVVCAAIAVFAGMAGASEIYTEGEDFKNLGGWKVADYAGATIALGDKIGAEAETEVEVKEAGKYYLFVRMMTHGGGFRSANFFVNDRDLGVAGDGKLKDGEKPGWRWTRLNTGIRLTPGKVKIRMISKSETTRLDCLYLSPDWEFQPVAKNIKNPNREKSGLQLEGIFRRPAAKGPGPKMLLLSGGRPWVGNACAEKFIRAGYNVNVLNSVYLDGMGGASIKQTPTDPVEPKAIDGITPEFKNLSKYEIIVINGIPENMQEKMFTKSRIEDIRKFVSNGGKLIVSLNVPESFGDLLPVESPDGSGTMDFEDGAGMFATRPDDPAFSLLPERWEIYSKIRNCVPRKGAKVLSKIIDADGSTLNVPYIAIMDFGKGKVLFHNANHERLQQSRQLLSWAYGPALFAGTAACICPGTDDGKVDPSRSLKNISDPATIRPKYLQSGSVELEIPKMRFSVDETECRMENGCVVFPNGYRLHVNTKGTMVDISRPGERVPFIRDMKLPLISYPKAADKVDDVSTAEATSVKSETQKSDAVWHISSIKAGKEAVITLVSNEGGEIEWSFKAASLGLDGRGFSGIGQSIRVVKLPRHLLAAIKLDYRVDLKNRRVRRFACYQPPRGYAEYDFTGDKDQVAGPCGFFSAAQPFGWLEGSNGVLAEFVTEASPVQQTLTARKGRPDASDSVVFGFGRVKAPQRTPWFWHMVCDAKHNSSNDWIAMYQFIRHYLRGVEGFPEQPALPCACYMNTCTPAEGVQVIDAAAKAGFRLFYVDNCPAPMEAFEKDRIRNQIAEIGKSGMKGYTWFPCCHSPDVTQTVKEHPEWYLKDETGKLASYFGHFHPADMNNPEFVKWYLGVVDGLMDRGLATAWHDMGGSASGTVNFGTPESKTGFWGQKEIFRHYYKRGGWAVTEGMNPLVLDGYIFRENDYNNPIGNEFAMIGAQVHWGGFRLDYFRLAMYDIFWPLDLGPVVFGFENKVGVIDRTKRAMNIAKAVNAALDATGMPFIRQTPFGTSWMSEKGGALFFFDGVKKLEASLPEGFVPIALYCGGNVTDLEGKMPASVEPCSVIVIKKQN